MNTRTARLALLTTTMAAVVAASGVASAQDVIVMRRVIAPPHPRAAAPTPSPTTTPAPSPTPAPTAAAPTPSPAGAPTPSPAPTPTYTYYWQRGALGTVTPACGPTTQAQASTCMRSDNTPADSETRCLDPRPEPQPATDYSTCTYKWDDGQWQGAGACGEGVTQTRTPSCNRSDGTNGVDASHCPSPAPTTSQQITDTSRCTYLWTPVNGATEPACGPSSRRITYACTRSDQTTITDSARALALCGVMPAATTDTTVSDYSACTYKWTPTSQWTGGPGTCGATIAQTRTTTCQRSDGKGDQNAGLCAGDKTGNGDTSRTITDTSQCTYGWKTNPGAWSSTCSTTATQPNNPYCQRQDGVPAPAPSYCDPATQPPAANTGNLTGCSYTPTYGAPYGMCDHTSSTRFTTLTKCVRSDQTDVTAANVSASYAYCAASSTQACTPAYAASYGSFGTCAPTAQGATTGNRTSPITACKADDGASVALSNCSGSPSTASNACTISSYSATYGSYGTCTGGAQSASISTCTIAATDNTNGAAAGGSVATSLCPAAKQTSTQSCNSGSISCRTTAIPYGVSSGTVAISKAATPSAGSARQYCQSIAPSHPYYNCYWDGANTTTLLYSDTPFTYSSTPKPAPAVNYACTATDTSSTCGTLAVNTYFTTGSADTVTIAVRGITTQAQAQASCNDYATSKNVVGTCFWNSTNQATYFAPGGTPVSQTGSNYFAAMCQ